jgi:hypothetical protein
MLAEMQHKSAKAAQRQLKFGKNIFMAALMLVMPVKATQVREGGSTQHKSAESSERNSSQQKA